jgi:prophage regulatory protein
MPTVEKDSELKRSAIYKLISEGSFPQPIKLTTRSAAWIKAEVREWIAK